MKECARVCFCYEWLHFMFLLHILFLKSVHYLIMWPLLGRFLCTNVLFYDQYVIICTGNVDLWIVHYLYFCSVLQCIMYQCWSQIETFIEFILTIWLHVLKRAVLLQMIWYYSVYINQSKIFHKYHFYIHTSPSDIFRINTTRQEVCPENFSFWNALQKISEFPGKMKVFIIGFWFSKYLFFGWGGFFILSNTIICTFTAYWTFPDS